MLPEETVSTPKPTPPASRQKAFEFTWETARDFAYLLVGAVIQALAMRLFLIPGELVSGGVSGGALIINHYTGWPIGLMVFVGNLPLFIIGWRFLGGPRFALRTVFTVAIFSIFTDLLTPYLPAHGVTGDLFLNTLFGALLLGVGLGIVYRGKGTSGGTDVLGRILNHRFHIPISQSYLMTDTLVVLLAGFAFDWTHSLYAMVVIYVSGIAAEMASEGTDVFRTALIITDHSEEVAGQIMTELERGVTILPGKGAYTGQERTVLYCVVTRAEVNQLKEVVHESDPAAFMVIGQAHEALGEGFRPLKR